MNEIIFMGMLGKIDLDLNSSAHNLIAIPEIKIRYIHGWYANIISKDASPRAKKSPKYKVKEAFKNKKAKR